MGPRHPQRLIIDVMLRIRIKYQKQRMETYTSDLEVLSQVFKP